MSDDEQRSPLSALLKDHPRRGRPRHAVSRQNVYVEMSARQKAQMASMAARLPKGLRRADIPDLAATILAARLGQLRRSVAGRNREMPEGIMDLMALYLLWDLPLPDSEPQKWTSIRLSPQQVIAHHNETLSSIMSFGLRVTVVAADDVQFSE